MLTRRGWALAASASGLALAGALVGIQELFALAIASVLLLGVSAAWVHGRSWQLLAVRDLHPSRVAAGGTARVELAVRNQALRRSPVVTAKDPFDGGRRAATFLLAPLAPGQAERAAYRLPTDQRGVFALGPLELTLSDPFGLVALTRFGAARSTITVHPRVERINLPPVAAGADRRSGARSAVLDAHGDEFFALRSYRTGDDLRRVHWSATARVGELMIRQEESDHRGRLTLALDLRRDAWGPSSLEMALSGAASVAAAAARVGVAVRLVDTGGGDTGFAGRTGGAGLLDRLAVADTHADTGEPLAAQLRRAGIEASGDALVVFTSDTSSDAEIAALARIAGSGRLLTVVVIEKLHQGSTASAKAPPDRPPAFEGPGHSGERAAQWSSGERAAQWSSGERAAEQSSGGGDARRSGGGGGGQRSGGGGAGQRPGPGRIAAGATVVRVPAGAEFTTAWDRAVGRRRLEWSNA